MKILTRYLIRSLAGPFAFAFALLTGLFFVNAVARLLDDLAGKGLPPEIIGEAFLLTLPHTIALTLPMAVLVAVLYTFGEMASASEIVAMSASGVRPRSLLVPTLIMGLLAGGATYTFNDWILPEANHRLKNLQSSIREKSPTFQLRERAVNRIEARDGMGPYFLKASAIDPASSELTDVVIYDMSPGIGGRRTTYASRGSVAMNRLSTDLQLRLHDGSVYEVDARGGAAPGGAFEQTLFSEQLHVLRGVGNLFEESGSDYRGDREMSVAQLRAAAAAKRAEADSLREDARAQARRAVEHALGIDAAADSLRSAPSQGRYSGDGMPRDDYLRSVTQDAAFTAGRIATSTTQANRYAAEMHKKYVIASACVVFVLLGVPVAIRFPRGGVSLVIVAATLVIALYQIGLNNGEDLADRGIASPFWAMWSPNLVSLPIALLMVARMGRWIGSVRRGAWSEMVANMGRLLRKATRRAGPA